MLNKSECIYNNEGITMWLTIANKLYGKKTQKVNEQLFNLFRDWTDRNISDLNKLLME